MAGGNESDKEIIIDSNHTASPKVGFLFSLSPLREPVSDSPYQSTAALRVGEGLGPKEWGERA